MLSVAPTVTMEQELWLVPVSATARATMEQMVELVQVLEVMWALVAVITLMVPVLPMLQVEMARMLVLPESKIAYALYVLAKAVMTRVVHVVFQETYEVGKAAVVKVGMQMQAATEV